MRKIAIEEHFTTQACQDALRSRKGFQTAERLLAP